MKFSTQISPPLFLFIFVSCYLLIIFQRSKRCRTYFSKCCHNCLFLFHDLTFFCLNHSSLLCFYSIWFCCSLYFNFTLHFSIILKIRETAKVYKFDEFLIFFLSQLLLCVVELSWNRRNLSERFSMVIAWTTSPLEHTSQQGYVTKLVQLSALKRK